MRGDAEAIDDAAGSNVHSFQRPDATYLDYDPTRTSLNGYGAQLALSKIGGQRVRFNTNVAAQESRVSTSTTSGSCGAPTSATMSNWLQWRNDTPAKYLRSFRFNLNQWAGWNFGGDRLYSGDQRQRARDVHEQLGHRRRRQRQPAALRRSGDPRRARRLRNSQR